MEKYIYQKFLLKCDYCTVNMEEVPKFPGNLEDISMFGEDYNLFDIGKQFIRKISLTEIDNRVDSAEDWNIFVDSLNELDALIIFSDGTLSQNKIIAEYRLATLKAYILRLQNDCKEVALYYNET